MASASWPTDPGAKPAAHEVGDALERPARRQLTVISNGAHADRVEPRVVGESLLRVGDTVMQRIDAFVQRFIQSDLNPLAQTGAIANTTFIIACVSGVVLLFWYKTSVHEAYGSIAQMMQAPWTAGLIRSLHRYSSDACMLFVLLHAFKLFVRRRFGGARWLAWVTGIFLVSTLWFVGWLGYWLVWDERGQQVAMGTARLLDVLPIFADPLSRSLLTDQAVNSLLFFVVFFLHMLIPLGMGIALWLHITRLSRSKFLTGRRMTIWLTLSLVALSLIAPADLAEPARMTVQPQNFAIDGWYLLPAFLTDRLQAGALWAIVLSSGAILYAIPWLLVGRRARVVEVDPARCNGCQLCYRDCPYDAIRMVPRSDGRTESLLASVDPASCLGCGICAGSCNSSAIGLKWFDAVDKRLEIDQLLKHAQRDGGSDAIAFVCGDSAGASLRIDPNTSECSELPGYRVVRVPCAGWVHPLSVERALRRGARGVLIAACGEGSCTYREGGTWAELRMSGSREPALRSDRMDPSRVRLVHLFRPQVGALRREAEALIGVAKPATRSQRPYRRVLATAAALVLVAVLAGATWGVTRINLANAQSPPLLIVSFKHPGTSAEICREPTADDLKQLPMHMRPKQICTRRRADVRLRVFVDGRRIVERAYEPRGIWHDGNSIAIERIPLPAGQRQVRVEVGDTPKAGEWTHVSEKRVQLLPGVSTVVVFDKMSGFRWFDTPPSR